MKLPSTTAKVIQVIEVKTVIGNGKDDPFRPLMLYFDLDGDLLAQDDRFKEISHD